MHVYAFGQDIYKYLISNHLNNSIIISANLYDRKRWGKFTMSYFVCKDDGNFLVRRRRLLKDVLMVSHTFDFDAS
jgi:hypothetical protein